MRKPKKRVKTTKAKKATKSKARGKLKPLPPGTYNFDIETCRISPPGNMVTDGVVTGRASAKDPPLTFLNPSSLGKVKPFEKMTRKELMEGFDRFRKYHDSIVDTYRLQLEAKERELAKWKDDYAHMSCVRADAISTRDRLLTILDKSYSEESRRSQ